MLPTEVPRLGVRILHVVRQQRRRVRSGIGLSQCGDAAGGFWGDAAILQEWSLADGAGAVGGRSDLRRTRQRANVVIEHVVAHTETATNRGVAAGARRISKADTRHKI